MKKYQISSQEYSQFISEGNLPNIKSARSNYQSARTTPPLHLYGEEETPERKKEMQKRER